MNRISPAAKTSAVISGFFSLALTGCVSEQASKSGSSTLSPPPSKTASLDPGQGAFDIDLSTMDLFDGEEIQVDREKFVQLMRTTEKKYPLATPQELAQINAKAFASIATNHAPELSTAYATALSHTYPAAGDFALLKSYVEELKSASPAEFDQNPLLEKIRSSNFPGRISIVPQVKGTELELTFAYIIHPWEFSPEAKFYKLNVSLTARRSDDTPIAYSNSNLSITPDDTISWKFDDTFKAPLPTPDMPVEVTLKMSYIALTDKKDFMSGHAEPELSTTFLLRPDAENPSAVIIDQGREPDLAEALIDTLNSLADRISWEEKVSSDPEVKRLEALWLGKKLPSVSTTKNLFILNEWRPEHNSEGDLKLERPLLMKFVAMSCEPCLASMPEYARIHEEEPEIDVVEMFHPEGVDGIESITVSPPLAEASREFWNKMSIYQFPTSMLIDTEGTIRWIGIGAMKPGYSLLEEIRNP